MKDNESFVLVSNRSFHICDKTGKWFEPENVKLKCVSKSKHHNFSDRKTLDEYFRPR